MVHISADRDYLSAERVAQILMVTPRRVRELARENTFPNAHRPGRSWLIPRADVEEYIKERYK